MTVRDWLQQHYEVSERLHIVPELLVDLQGPELRIGTLDIPLSLSENQLIFLVSEKSFDKRKENSAIFSRIIAGEDELSIIPCPDILFSYFDEGQEVKLNDGKIVLELSAPLEEDIFCAKVKKGGELTSRKSIAIKDVTVPLPVLTETDKQNLKLLRKYHVTGVMLPFVRNADDLITLRKELCADGMDYIRIFAKIESLEGVENLPSLLPFCDEIVIARGESRKCHSSAKTSRHPETNRHDLSACKETIHGRNPDARLDGAKSCTNQSRSNGYLSGSLRWGFFSHVNGRNCCWGLS